MKTIKAAIIGVTGYTGSELFRMLGNHPNVQIKYVTSVSYTHQKLSSIYQNFFKTTEICCEDGSDLEKIAQEVDVLFLALPHGIASKQISNAVLSYCKVIDLGADFRLKSQAIYEKWYGVEHGSPKLLESAVYGLCEIRREAIKNANLVANPGCYTTCSILSLFPLVKEKIVDLGSIVIDAKSGVSGAGRGANTDQLYCECSESVKAYKISAHRHTPEIEQELSIAAKRDILVTFTPHLVPLNRGILTTIYGKLVTKLEYREIRKIYEKYYRDEYFIRIFDENHFPEIRWVKGSNFKDIGFKIDERTRHIIVVGALDNLIKGAAGQAVQNMNLMFGLNEKTALTGAGMFPI